jgi:D-galacturonate reductase
MASLDPQHHQPQHDQPQHDQPRPLSVLMLGTGEYTTGYVHGSGSDSDKGAGVVALVLFDLRRVRKVGRLGMCGTNGSKFDGIRKHLTAKLACAYPRSFSAPERGLAFDAYPRDPTAVDPRAFEAALREFAPGDAAVIFTPDDTHYELARACLERGLHVLVTKPAVKTLAQHLELQALARARDLLCAVEVHKRWDPVYVDARDRLRSLGSLSYFSSYMSQPKHQLDTFRAWAGRGSDISYYLNSHHVDFHAWCERGRALPVRVTAHGSTGLASARDGFPPDCEDTITLCVDWRNHEDGSRAHATYTASWAAPRSEVHSQQRFHWLGRNGEISVDQAKRGYTSAEDGVGFGQRNPHFMKYTPSDGRFAGQGGYGFRSIEAFVDAVNAIRAGRERAADYDDGRLATLATTAATTAVLEAGRISLDAGGAAVAIVYGDPADPHAPTRLELA